MNEEDGTVGFSLCRWTAAALYHPEQQDRSAVMSSSQQDCLFANVLKFISFRFYSFITAGC